MTRFILLPEGVDGSLVPRAKSWGEILPKIPSYKIMDLAEAINPGREREIVGIDRREDS